MPIHYADIKPWGRSFDEYNRMFSLTEADRNRRILGCGDGPAAFNAAMARLGKKVCSVDPIYAFSRKDIERRIEESYADVIAQTRANRDKFIWTTFQSVDELGQVRMRSMKEFLADYDAGKTEGRYVCAELPELPFQNKEFGLALCSHFLFLYTDNLSYEFHRDSLLELLRVADEVRVFPLLDANADRSMYVEGVIDAVTRAGYRLMEESVNYEFQRGGNTMLRITRQEMSGGQVDGPRVAGV